MRALLNRSCWRKGIAVLALMNFLGMQIISSALAVNITSVSVQKAIITPVLTGFALSTGSSPVPLGSTAPTINPPTSASTGAITYTSATPGVAT